MVGIENAVRVVVGMGTAETSCFVGEDVLLDDETEGLCGLG